MQRTDTQFEGRMCLGVLANRKIYGDDFFREICAIKPPGKKTGGNWSNCVAWSSWILGWREGWQWCHRKHHPAVLGNQQMDRRAELWRSCENTQARARTCLWYLPGLERMKPTHSSAREPELSCHLFLSPLPGMVARSLGGGEGWRHREARSYPFPMSQISTSIIPPGGRGQ